MLFHRTDMARNFLILSLNTLLLFFWAQNLTAVQQFLFFCNINT